MKLDFQNLNSQRLYISDNNIAKFSGSMRFEVREK